MAKIQSRVNPNFPSSNRDQPSQGFRDNFKATKDEIESLQRKKVSVFGDCFGTSEQVGAGIDAVRLKIHLSDNLIFPGQEGIVPPKGNTLQRPKAPAPGQIRFNEDKDELETWGYNRAGGIWEWISMCGGDSSDVTFDDGIVLQDGARLLIDSGSLSEPSLAFRKSPSSGMYMHLDSVISFANNGTEVMRLADDSIIGLVGISAPSVQTNEFTLGNTTVTGIATDLTGPSDPTSLVTQQAVKDAIQASNELGELTDVSTELKTNESMLYYDLSLGAWTTINMSKFVRVDRPATKTSGDLKFADGVSLKLGNAATFNSSNKTATVAIDPLAGSLDIDGTDTTKIASFKVSGVSLNHLGVQRFNTINTGVKVTGETETDKLVVFDNGSANNPSIRFDDSHNVGFYRPSENAISTAIANKDIFTVSETATTTTVPLNVISGSVLMPSIRFEGTDNIGLYKHNQNVLGIAINNSTIAMATANELISNVTHRVNSGTLTNLSYKFIGDEDTGFYNKSSGVTTFVSNGVEKLSIGDGINTSDVVFHSSGSVTLPSGSESERPASTEEGMVRYNNEINKLEYYNNNNWIPVDGYKPWKIVTSDYSISNYEQIMVDSSAGPLVVELPLNPKPGDQVKISDATGSFAIHNLHIVRNGSNIMGLDEDTYLNRKNITVELVFINTIYGWRIV